MRRPLPLVALVLGIVALVISPAQAQARPAPPQQAMGWYLALGDSLAAGYQPGLGDDPTGGYAGLVLASVQKQTPKTQLVNLGCSGETTTSMLGGGICSYDKGSQLGQAVQFLKAHAGTTRLVTLDIGANNVTPCARPAIDQACMSRAIGTVGRDLAAITRQLRAAAPGVEIVVLNYYDPFLAAWLAGPQGQQLAVASVPLLGVLNSTIATATVGVDGRVADVATAFDSTNFSGSPVPKNVATICGWTWMCAKGDIHPNDAGYAVLAGAVDAVR